MRRIDADALKKEFEKIYPLATNEMGGVVNKQIYDIIDNAPTVSFMISPDYVTELQNLNKELIKQLEEVEQPTGEWARHDMWRNGAYIGGFYHINCPCEDGYYAKWRTNFCPNCGLPMKKGSEMNETDN